MSAHEPPHEPPTTTATDPDAECRVVALLEGYLRVSEHFSWPGTDGLTAKDVVKELYLVASVLGRVPDPTELARRHPELATAVTAFFL